MLAILGATFPQDRSGLVPKKDDPAERTLTDGTSKNALPDDLLEQESRKLVGTDAVDCGRVPIAGDPKAASDCALTAQNKGKPFRVRYDIPGIDSFLAVAMVRTPIGTVSVLQYDSDPSGGGRRGGGVIYPNRCPEPVHLWLNSIGRVNCFQQNSPPLLSAP
jgi:hypothetical protein